MPNYPLNSYGQDTRRYAQASSSSATRVSEERRVAHNIAAYKAGIMEMRRDLERTLGIVPGGLGIKFYDNRVDIGMLGIYGVLSNNSQTIARMSQEYKLRNIHSLLTEVANLSEKGDAGRQLAAVLLTNPNADVTLGFTHGATTYLETYPESRNEFKFVLRLASEPPSSRATPLQHQQHPWTRHSYRWVDLGHEASHIMYKLRHPDNAIPTDKTISGVAVTELLAVGNIGPVFKSDTRGIVTENDLRRAARLPARTYYGSSRELNSHGEWGGRNDDEWEKKSLQEWIAHEDSNRGHSHG